MSSIHQVTNEEIERFKEKKALDRPKLIATQNDCGLAETVRCLFAEYFDTHQNDIPQSGLYDCVLKEIEKPLIEECLKATSGNQKKASEILGLNRNTLKKKMTILGISADKTK